MCRKESVGGNLVVLSKDRQWDLIRKRQRRQCVVERKEMDCVVRKFWRLRVQSLPPLSARNAVVVAGWSVGQSTPQTCLIVLLRLIVGRWEAQAFRREG